MGFFFFFFFQAEDGIRDIGVTGVQTCALPILGPSGPTRSSATTSSMRESTARVPEGPRGSSRRDPVVRARHRGVAVKCYARVGHLRALGPLLLVRRVAPAKAGR